MRQISFYLLILIFNSVNSQVPVTPNPSPESKELLEFIYSISGKYTLTGQHCQPLYKDILFERVNDVIGDYPAVFGQDFGFSPPNSLDGINFRQRIVDDAIAWHNKGAIITLMWHAVPPYMDEPVSFKNDIQGKITNEQWKELITEGSELNLRWKSQVDVIAFFLKQLRDAKVPVIWRPYHEMNGPWFWWGDKKGEDGYKRLYKMLFERLVNFHKINNLIWVFNANEINPPWVDKYESFYPGAEFVDILATDVYRNNYSKNDYESLLELANGKPIALGEVGHLPTPGQLKEQPKWVWFMAWADIFFNGNKQEERSAIYSSEQTITLKELNQLRMKEINQ
jgi:mannan endo-1,4-beta-mannosidase